MLSPAVKLRRFAAETTKSIASQIPDPDLHFCAGRPLCSCAKHRGAKPEGLLSKASCTILYHKQKCLLARAFLCRPSIVHLCEAQRGEARRLAEQGFLHILYHKQNHFSTTCNHRFPDPSNEFSRTHQPRSSQSLIRKLCRPEIPAHSDCCK